MNFAEGELDCSRFLVPHTLFISRRPILRHNFATDAISTADARPDVIGRKSRVPVTFQPEERSVLHSGR